jgi:uncharacterized membrane protein (UPF0127 family)
MDVVEMDGPGGGWRLLVPRTRRERMRGLRGHPPPGPRVGMLFRRCRSVHTFGMEHAIRLAFLDRELRIVAMVAAKPRRLFLPRRRTRHILECDDSSELRIGDRFRATSPGGT